ncbi:protein of unknown function [Chitinophaga jiangningensis]|uniref:DUF4834 domain-containing protein n=1 Tax=Chitinophaga jiangningensis TaxID=1419482 RepID=A0A1M7ECV9_9BACT|nr:DUF4834 family protein [Chitinophaga jiangningensis]SHL89458.1 protein of unknown function [Chitinophaga jiangningensis]
MLKTLIYLFLAWLLYKLVFDFIIPIYRSTKVVRRQMSDMQEAMRQQYEQQQAAQQGYSSQQQKPPVSRPESKPDKGDYIDFEEIK